MIVNTGSSAQSKNAAIVPVSAYPFTFACWAYWGNVGSGSGTPTALEVYDAGGGNDLFYLGKTNNTNTVRMFWRTTSNATLTSTTTLTAGQVVHIAGVWTATDVLLYVNGVQEASHSANPQAEPIVLSNVRILTSSVEAGVAEAAIWNRVLSPTEAAALAKGYSPQRFRRSLALYIPGWRPNAAGNVRDWISGTELTSGTAASAGDHPPIIYPKPRRVVSFAAAAPPTGNRRRRFFVGAAA